MTADEIREHITVLTRFEVDYERLIDAQRRGDLVTADELRRSLIRSAARAQRAVSAWGGTFLMTPAPMIGGPPLTNLAEMVSAHERPAFGWHAAQIMRDGLTAIIGGLEDKLDSAREDQRSSSPPRELARERMSGRFGRVANHPWTVTIVGGAVAAVLASVIVYLTLR